MENVRAGDLAQLVDQANLVFIGKVERVAYRNARGDKGEGVIPYTIVTYRIGQVLRGKPPGKEITMRFVGGPDGRGRFLSVSGVPLIQQGDQDLLFVATTDDASCPLVYCEHGRYRILNEQVFNTYGSPVRAIVKSKVLSRGMPPKPFRTARFPAPKFDELIQNPEVAERLKAQNMSVEDARRRYEAEAPKFVEFAVEFPVRGKASDAGKVGPSTTGAQPAAGSLTGPTLPVEPASSVAAAMPLPKFIAVTLNLAKLSKRRPTAVRSVDPAAEIVVAKVNQAVPQRLASPASQSADEYKAFEQNGFDPVIRK